MADAGQYQKVRDILLSDPSRRVVIVSAAGKRHKDDHKITDLLYLCHAHIQYGVDCTTVYEMITSRYLQIRDELGLELDLESEFAQLKARLDKKKVTQDALVSRGEYFSARLMAALLGFKFVDAADWIRFRLDGTVDQEASYNLLRTLAGNDPVVIPGFYGAMPDGRIHVFSRGGSDITGSLAAAALDADVYENWTDVSGILMADPRIVDDPQAIPEVTYDELRELSYSGAQVLHEGSIFPVREKGIPLNIRNTNAPEDAGTLIKEAYGSFHVQPTGENTAKIGMDVHVKFGWFFRIFISRKVYSETIDWRLARFVENLKLMSEGVVPTDEYWEQQDASKLAQ
jgi:aspartate kinase